MKCTRYSNTILLLFRCMKDGNSAVERNLIGQTVEVLSQLYVTEYQNVPTLPNSSPYYCSKVELHLVTGMAADGENYTMYVSPVVLLVRRYLIAHVKVGSMR